MLFCTTDWTVPVTLQQNVTFSTRSQSNTGHVDYREGVKCTVELNKLNTAYSTHPFSETLL